MDSVQSPVHGDGLSSIADNIAHIPRIADFYKDRCVLITGATGFMGKVLVEKLIRSCPGVKVIYMLMRSKRGVDPRQRIEELLNAKLFERLKQDQPDFVNKLVPIAGDITLPGLGISSSDARLLADNVSIVFHSAATVKFDEELKMSVNMNVQGTRRMVDLCHTMTNLVALVHVSTAYANCNREEITENIYPVKVDPKKLIDAIEWMDEDLIKAITPLVIGDRPNTYTFTKALAENILVEESGSLPLAIIRPSIVTASWKEPIPGWVDNLNGPTGLIAGAGKGLLRTLLCHRSAVADMVPVDVPINLMIASAWYTAVYRPNNALVYNCTSGNINRVTWGDMERLCYPILLKNPMCDILRYPGGNFKANKMHHEVCVFFEHFLPAYIYDTIFYLVGRKPIMVKLHTRMSKAIQCLEFFTTHQWRFSNENLFMLLNKLSPEDKKTFNFDIRPLHWPTYFEQYCLGTKRFMLKEDLSTLPHARKQLKKLWYMEQTMKFLSIFAMWKVIAWKYPPARHVWYAMLVVAMKLLQFMHTLVKRATLMS